MMAKKTKSKVGRNQDGTNGMVLRKMRGQE